MLTDILFPAELQLRVDGVEMELYKAPFIYKGRTMMPLKFVSELFDCDVSWNQETFTVHLSKEDFDIQPLKTEPVYGPEPNEVSEELLNR